MGRGSLGKLEIEGETVMLIDPAGEALKVDSRHALWVAIEMEPAAEMKRIVGELALNDGALALGPGELKLDGTERYPVCALSRRAHIQLPMEEA